MSGSKTQRVERITREAQRRMREQEAAERAERQRRILQEREAERKRRLAASRKAIGRVAREVETAAADLSASALSEHLDHDGLAAVAAAAAQVRQDAEGTEDLGRLKACRQRLEGKLARQIAALRRDAAARQTARTLEDLSGRFDALRRQIADELESQRRHAGDTLDPLANLLVQGQAEIARGDIPGAQRALSQVEQQIESAEKAIDDDRERERARMVRSLERLEAMEDRMAALRGGAVEAAWFRDALEPLTQKLEVARSHHERGAFALVDQAAIEHRDGADRLTQRVEAYRAERIRQRYIADGYVEFVSKVGGRAIEPFLANADDIDSRMIVQFRGPGRLRGAVSIPAGPEPNVEVEIEGIEGFIAANPNARDLLGSHAAPDACAAKRGLIDAMSREIEKSRGVGFGPARSSQPSGPQPPRSQSLPLPRTASTQSQQRER